MDSLDRFNESVNKVVTNWRSIFAFVAAVYVIGTILEVSRNSGTAWVIISWVIVAVMAFLVFFPRKRGKKEEETPHSL